MLSSIKIVTLLNVFVAVHGFPRSQSCGKSFNTSQPDWRVVGGADAGVGEFPWHVILTLAEENKINANDNNFCGGTIINERWILTAAHCIHRRSENTLKVRLGVHNFKIQEEGQEVNIFVEKFVPHQHFNIYHFIANDIALIKLNESLDFSGKHKHLSPICLARSDSKLTNKCVATGFGFINTQEQRPINGVLQKVDEPYAPNSVCRILFLYFNETQQVCAGGLATAGKAVCNGDSGGPLQCQAEDSRWHQVGIVSFGGRPCAQPNIPQVFTKVSAYVDWIEKTVSTH